MKFILSWLKEFLDTDASLETICHTLTMIGLEVEEVVNPVESLAAFKIAQILDAKPHPDADKLQVCRVNTGQEELQIVCGAPNARAGINVVLAPVGAIIPTNGMKIKQSKIRGVESCGMLCSAAELGLGDDHSGIIELPASKDNIAKDYVDVAGLNDPMIEIAITPNRGDCLGVYGIARDLAAAGVGTLKPLTIDNPESAFSLPVTITTEDETLCPLFIGRYFKEVKNCDSPEWMKQRLEAIGLKPISALVDITNYISYTFGRPLHVYDAAKLSGGLIARKAKNGETITALDEKEYTLDDSMLVIADDSSVQAIGGVIGGLQSGCTLDTTEVVLEVALFDPINVAATGRKLDINTDSRYRFERTVDPAFVHDACAIASKMILDLCGGQASEPVVAGTEPTWQRRIEFDFNATQERTGIDVDANESQRILEHLGFSVNGSKVEVPSWRSDVTESHDLVEEITRIYGYDHIPNTPLPLREEDQKALNINQIRFSKVRRVLAASGLTEAVTWSFMSLEKAKIFGGGAESLTLQNPISSEWDVMRPSMLSNLIDASKRNADRGIGNIALFETGLVYHDTTPQGQIPVVSGIRAGEVEEKSIYGKARNADVFDAKADALEALEVVGAPVGNLRITTNAPDYYHPGRSGVLRLGKNALGYFGQIHPAILKALDVDAPVVGFELFIGQIPTPKKKKSTAKPKLELSDYQSSTRDFAFVVDSPLAAGDVIKAVASADKNLIADVTLFDVYQGEHIQQGKKSLAFSVLIQPKDKTLNEKELELISANIIKAVEKLGGVLRG